MNTETRTFVFSPKEGSIKEYHILLSVTDPSLSFEEQVESIIKSMEEASSGRTVHFRRFFLSDAANQVQALEKALETFTPVPTSMVQQPPLDGTKVALWMYCTSPVETPGGVPSHNGYSHHWHGSLTASGEDSRTQVFRIFKALDLELDRKGMSVARNTIRTWLFTRDVDVNYLGVVEGRKDFFKQVGLGPDTHFIASTGIEGRHPDWRNTVEMDAYSIGGLSQGQVAYLQARSHLNPTYDYGVTFERGTAVTYGDRRHIFISGTASIDSEGNVLYPGDVEAQTGRMLENISALLSEAEAGLADVAMAIVYLRDASDFHRVKEVVSRTCPSLDALYVLAPVCRPAWLVEMECLAVTSQSDRSFPEF